MHRLTRRIRPLTALTTSSQSLLGRRLTAVTGSTSGSSGSAMRALSSLTASAARTGLGSTKPQSLTRLAGMSGASSAPASTSAPALALSISRAFLSHPVGRALLRQSAAAMGVSPRVLGRHFSSAFGSYFGQRLKQLEMEAAQNPADLDRLAAYLTELNSRNRGTEVVRKLESLRGVYGVAQTHQVASQHSEVHRQYIKALNSSGLIESERLGPAPHSYAPPPPLQQPPQSPPPQQPYSQSQVDAAFAAGHQSAIHSMNMSANSNSGGLGDGAGTAANPIHVQSVQPNTLGSRLYRLVSGAAMLAMLLFVGWQFYFMATAKSGPLGMKGVVKEVGPERPRTRFSDVKGCDEAKHELQEVVKFLRRPDEFNRLGGKMPKGVLLMGPPGTGKTLLAKAVAGEAGVPFFYCSGSEFEEMFVGVGAKRVRELFEAAKKKSPAIIFIDEIDALGGKRSMRELHATRMTLNQLLTEMDGFQTNNHVIVIAATNFPQSLDPALLRPGRFDRHVEVPLPDIKGRKEILDLYLKGKKKASDVDTLVLARGTPGSSGADLFNLINTAAIRASGLRRESISMAELEYAKDKVLMGAERKSTIIPHEVRRTTAYHEGGHALMAIATHGAMPLHKATIIPRGRALGLTHQLPEERNMYSKTRAELQAELDVCMGGRVAEEIAFGDANVTTGASNDLERATDVARRMVMHYGMSERIGLISVSEQHLSQLSSHTRQVIDEEVAKILAESHARTRAVLDAHREDLHRLATALLKYETLSADEMRAVMKGEVPPSLKDVPHGASSSSSSTASKSSSSTGGGGMAVPIPEPAALANASAAAPSTATATRAVSTAADS